MKKDNVASSRLSRNRRGSVLVPVVIVVIAMGMITMILVDSARTVADRAARKAEDERLLAAGDAAIDLAMHEIWKGYLAAQGGVPGSIGSAQTFLNAYGIPKLATPSSPPVGGTWGNYGNEAPKGAVQLLGKLDAHELAWNDLLSKVPLTLDGNAKPRVGDARVHDLSIVREDGASATALRVKARVSFGDNDTERSSREVERLYYFAGDDFKGFGFGMLANNVNCIMCHAEVDSTERYYNTDPSKWGTFDRVRVGTLESFKIRANSANSRIGGTLYTRGPFMDKNGSLIANFATTTVKGGAIDAQGRMIQDAFGNLTTVNLQAAAGTPLPTLQNLYINYPKVEVESTDGILPEAFPPVIPDQNGNRKVDPAEFASITTNATGSISGGLKTHVPTGGQYAGGGLPWTDSAATIAGTVSGNVVLRGTAAQPLVLNGRIAVDGDIVIEGVVKGEGELIAGGNIYVVGSVRYDDGVDANGKRTYGVGADGKSNRLTVAAGGNILVGNFMSASAASPGGPLITGSTNGGFNFALSEMSLFNQMEWTKTRPTLPGQNNTQVVNPLYDPNHKPRYYAVNQGDPVPIFNGGQTYFSAATKTWLGSEHASSWNTNGLSKYFPGNPMLANATVLSLLPANGWIDGAKLKEMWTATQNAHPGGPMQIDALLYTNNATFLLAPKGSVYKGQVVLNGGLIGADMGILVPGTGSIGLQLNYDSRQNGVLKLQDTGKVTLKRGFRIR